MNRTRYVAQGGVIAAVYAALTIGWMSLTSVLPPALQLSWGLVQLRISEAATVLAFFTPAAVPGLTLGSVIANAVNPATPWPMKALDVVFGSLGTCLGAWWTWRFRKNTPLGLAGPVIANALVVPAYLPFLLAGFGLYKIPFTNIDIEGNWLPMYLLGVVLVGLGEAIVVYGLGWPLLVALRRLGLGSLLGERS